MDILELLGEDLFKQVTEKLGDKKIIVNDGSFVPRDRLNEVNQEKKDLKVQLENLNVEFEKMKASLTGNDELQKTLEGLKLQNEELNKKHAMTEINSELKLKAIEMKAKDVNDILKFVDYEAINSAEDKAKVIGEQLKGLKETKSYFFNDDNDNTNSNALNPTQQRTISNLSELDKYNELKEAVRKSPGNSQLMQSLFLQKAKLK